MLNIVMIGIANALHEHDEKYELHRLLSTILSMELSVDEKLGIMETEYHIPVDDKLRKDVSAMCNLSQGIKDNTLADAKTEKQKVKENMIMKLFESIDGLLVGTRYLAWGIGVLGVIGSVILFIAN